MSDEAPRETVLYAEFRGGKSMKFYEVTFHGEERITFRWGRIGTAGQAKPGYGDFAAREQFNSKLAKGYVQLQGLEILAAALPVDAPPLVPVPDMGNPKLEKRLCNTAIKLAMIARDSREGKLSYDQAAKQRQEVMESAERIVSMASDHPAAAYLRCLRSTSRMLA